MSDAIIFSYSRAQAIEDGVLVDVSDMAKEAGFRFPVAMTAAVWQSYVRVPEEIEGQDEAGRLWDILWMLKVKIAGCEDGLSEIFFELLVRNNNRQAKLVRLKSLCGPGDNLEPVITILLPDED